MGNGESLDLYKLFLVVKKKGGYDAVCKNSLWDLVGEEYGLGVKVGSSVELVYSKHLISLEKCFKNVAGGKFAGCGLEDDRVKFHKHLMEANTVSILDDSGDELQRRECGCPDGRKLRSSNRVKGVKLESNGAEHESAYEYLDGRKSCGSNSVKDKNSDSNGNEFDNVCDYLEGRKLCGTNRGKGVIPESNGAKKVWTSELVDLDMLEDHEKGEPIIVKFCGFNTEMDILEEFDESKLLTVDASDAESEESDMLKLSDGSKRCNKDDEDDSDEVLILDPSNVDKEKFGQKRKGESMTEMLIWMTRIAKNPCDPAVGLIPEKSKWKSYSNHDIWKQVLLFREAAFLKKDFATLSERFSWQSQKMHPAMYDDRVGTIYNFRQRLKCDKRILLGKSTSDGVSSSSSKRRTLGGLERTPSSHAEVRADKKLPESCTALSSLDKCARMYIPVGPNHQAEVPKWTGMTCESDSKWLGTKIWPSKFVNSKLRLIERDPIGKGRKDSCGCQVQGSVECVRFHIAEKRSKVKMELGEAFYQWNLDKVGEEVSYSWTEQDEKKFKDIVKSNPASLEKCFWDQLFKTFPKKSREDLVSYYFNVFLLQRRAYQNRHTPDNIDSDDDESEFTPLRKVFGHQTPKSRSITLLSPKKFTEKGK